MKSRSHSPSSDVRTLLHEKLDAMLDECDLVMDNADFGQVLEQKLQERIERNETTDEGKQCPHCKKKRKFTPRNPKP